MKYKKLLEFAEPYLKKNDFDVDHTLRVLDIAKRNYDKYNLDDIGKDVVFSLIVLHDIGGSTIKEQYENGPRIAKILLEKLKYSSFDIKLICYIIERHHERLNNPHDIFKILFDSDQLAKFSKEEFNHYNSRDGFSWEKVIESIYHDELKALAKSMLKKKIK